MFYFNLRFKMQTSIPRGTSIGSDMSGIVGINREDDQRSNYYNNSLSDDYEDFIKSKSQKLRRKSKSLLERLQLDNELNNYKINNAINSTRNSLNFETKSQDRVSSSDTHSHMDIYSSVCFSFIN